MYKMKHFLGYGIILPSSFFRKSPYGAENLERFMRKNHIVGMDAIDPLGVNPRDKFFVGIILDTKDDDFLEKMKEAENDFPIVFQDIFKVKCPIQYKPKMISTYGDMWEDE